MMYGSGYGCDYNQNSWLWIVLIIFLVLVICRNDKRHECC